MKSGSESSLSDIGETTSAKESSRRHDDKDTCSDNGADDKNESGDDIDHDVDSDEKDYDNEKGLEKDSVTHRSKLQKQDNVVLRHKAKGNPIFRKSKWCFKLETSIRAMGQTRAYIGSTDYFLYRH